jgi:peptidoglycan/LPS O-acetylase OafA/YrhL
MNMKKPVLILIVAAIVIITCGLWIINSSMIFGHKNILSLVVIILLVGFAVFIGFKQLTSVKRGEPTEDELSKKMLIKASSISYYISIYLWLFIMYFSEKIKIETHTLIGVGIIGMALIFALSWVIIYFRGIRNE